MESIYTFISSDSTNDIGVIAIRFLST